MANYVERGGAQTFAQPLLLEGMRFWGFMFEANEAALQATVDRYINQPCKGELEYHVLGPRVILGVADFAKVTVSQGAPKEFYTPEVDVAFWIPLVAVKRVAGIPFAERLVWYMAYVFVDNPWAIATGREVFGFPKEWAVFQVPKELSAPAVFAVDSLVVKEFGPNSLAKRGRLFEVRRLDGNASTEFGVDWKDESLMVRSIFEVMFGTQGSRTLPGPGLVVEIFKFLVHREYPLVFLKQFRDIADGNRACYQAIAEAPVQLTKFRTGGWLKGEYEMRIEEYQSHPIVAEMGLGQATVKTMAALYVEFDFTIGNGRELWKA
jgi:hypothetical protein